MSIKQVVEAELVRQGMTIGKIRSIVGFNPCPIIEMIDGGKKSPHLRKRLVTIAEALGASPEVYLHIAGIIPADIEEWLLADMLHLYATRQKMTEGLLNIYEELERQRCLMAMASRAVSDSPKDEVAREIFDEARQEVAWLERYLRAGEVNE